MEVDCLWTSENIFKFIESRSKFPVAFDDPTKTESYVWEHILDELDLSTQLKSSDAQQFWNFLLSKYKEYHQSTLENVTTHWPYYAAMHNILSLEGIMTDTDLLPKRFKFSKEEGLEETEKTIEEEAAILEEAFRNGNLVTLRSVDIDDQIEPDGDSDPSAGSSYEDETTFHHKDMGISDNSAVWTDDTVQQFILLRGQKNEELSSYGSKYIFGEILKEMELINQVSVVDARRKWTSLVNYYLKIKDNEESSEEKGEHFSTDWPNYSIMKEVMEKIKTSPASGTKGRKTSDNVWCHDVTRKFIRLRAEKHSEIASKGHNAVYQEILDTLKVNNKITVAMARKKWNNLLRRYEDEEASGNNNTWIFMKDMKLVMKQFSCSDAAKLKSRASPEFLWPNELTKKFIGLRIAKHASFVENGIQNTYLEIMEELGLDHILNPNQLRKKWNYLVAKYKELSCTTAPDGSTPAPHTWPFYDDMHSALQTIPEHLLRPTKMVKVNFENIWTKETLLRFIRMRGEKSEDSSRVSAIYTEMIDELGLGGQVTVLNCRKKWNYLYGKYVDLSRPDVDDFTRQSWPYYTAMQQAVGILPPSQIISKKGIMEEWEDEEEIMKKISKKTKEYICFLCGKTSKLLNDFFMFEQSQHLLHTQKTVLEIISNLLSRKTLNMEATTCLCSRCTNIVNEADSIINRHNRLKEETQQLYQIAIAGAKAEKERLQLQQRNEMINSSSATTPPLNSEEENVNPEELISYSKRGRKRKANILSGNLGSGIKTEPLDNEFESLEGDAEFDEDSDHGQMKKRARLSKRGRAKSKGRGKKRGRPASKTTLIGRGLSGQYPTSNKRKTVAFKGPKIYHCTECKAEFKKYTELITHRKDLHTVIDTSTLEVEETVLENGVITYFNKGKANNFDTSHPCRECDKKFLRKDDLCYHQEIAHTKGRGRAKTAFKDRSYACEECGETFLFKYKLKMHINSKHLNDTGQNANDFTCGECGCKLGSLPGLTFHLRKHHNKALTYRKSTEYLCNDCGFLAPSNKKLKEHQEAHCGSSTKPKVQCELCGKTVLKVSLKMHKVKMHSDFKEQCDRCGERYATKTDLLRHINVIHLRILLYSCTQCGEKFPTSDSLRYHRVKVHEKPSFSCHICMKAYKRVGELNTHMKRTHSDRRKAESCQYCGKEYYDRSGLRNHLVSKHNVPQEMTYSENYLRKKRVDGLPLAKHFEKSTIKVFTPVQNNDAQATQHQQQSTHQNPSQLQPQQPPQSQRHPPNAGHPPHTHMGQHSHLRVVDEAAEAARNLGTYQDIPHHAHEEESSLVVTEISEDSPQVQQTVLVDTLGPPQPMMHPAQVTHMQAPMTMHHHMHHPMQHHPNARFSVLYQMNMPHPGPSHINM